MFRSDDLASVISSVVEQDLCVGCGICAYRCPRRVLTIDWNSDGFLVAKQSGTCDACQRCLDVCPFSPEPVKEAYTEDEIAIRCLPKAPQRDPRIGTYYGTYAGHALSFRKTSSSGGLATYVFSELLSRRVVEHVFSVKASNGPENHYQYAVTNRGEDLLEASKTRYYPVTLATAFNELERLSGRVAVSAVSCFAKALRLGQLASPALREKIPFVVGIICGGIKSRFFTEYLASRVGVGPKAIRDPEYRIKNPRTSAGDYSFGCVDGVRNASYSVPMRSVGDMWGTGLFKANACDFCDDVATELADISLGDAWVNPYVKDGRGSNVVVTRTPLAESIIREGSENGRLKIEAISLEQFISSQGGSFNHRQDCLPFRADLSLRQGRSIPPKRFLRSRLTADSRLVQLLRRKTRRKSFQVWKSKRESRAFDRSMRALLLLLRVLTKISKERRNRFGENRSERREFRR